MPATIDRRKVLNNASVHSSSSSHSGTTVPLQTDIHNSSVFLHPKQSPMSYVPFHDMLYYRLESSSVYKTHEINFFVNNKLTQLN